MKFNRDKNLKFHSDNSTRLCHGKFQNYPQGQKPLVYRHKLHFEYIHQVWWVNGHSEPNYVICYSVMAMKSNLKSEKCTSAKLKLCCSTSAIHQWPWFSLNDYAKRKKNVKNIEKSGTILLFTSQSI